jgi:nicotinamide mononucleotide transporter
MEYMNWIELIGVVFGLICVWLTTKQNIWCWPVGIVSIAAFLHTFWQAKLYPDVVLQVVFLWLSIYGWAKWGFGSVHWKQMKTIPVSRIDLVWATWIGSIAVYCTVLLGYLFTKYTDAAMPYFDSFILVISLIAQYLMARKILESWFYWIAVDVVAIGVYASRELYMTSALYFVYLILCIKGYYEWKQEKQA